MRKEYFILLLLDFYGWISKFFYKLYNVNKDTRTYLKQYLYDGYVSNIAILSPMKMWVPIYNYENISTIRLIYYYILNKFGYKDLPMFSIEKLNDIIGESFIPPNENDKVNSYYTYTYYKDGNRCEVIYDVYHYKKQNQKSNFDIGYAMLKYKDIDDDKSIDITHLIKEYITSLSEINISVEDFVNILCKYNKLNIKDSKDNISILVFDMNNMQEQVFKENSIIKLYG